MGRRVTERKELLNADPPAQCSRTVVAMLERACQIHGAGYQLIISRVSHRPDEYSSPEAVAQRTLVLAEALGCLAV